MIIYILNLSKRVIAKIKKITNQYKHIFGLFIENLIIHTIYLVYSIIKFLYKNKAYENNKILLCRYKYYGNQKDESLEKIHLEDTINNYNVKLENFYWDNITTPGTNLFRLFIKLLKIQPNILILSSYNSSNKRPLTQPTYESLSKLKKLKIFNFCVAIWWDTCSSTFIRKNLANETPIDLHVIVDNPLFDTNSIYLDNTEKNKIITLFCPYNINGIFYSRIKQFNYSFVGQADSYRNYRKKYLDHLMDSKIPGLVIVQNRINQISQLEYAEILGKSKIGINFSYSTDQHQLKARVFEIILSGALLFESNNNQISELFNENIDYVSFNTNEELVEKMNFYLNNDSERNKIITNAEFKLKNLYNGIRFWEIIFKKLNICIELQS